MDLKEKVSKMPNIESFVSMSKDGKWIIHKTVITDIKSKKYYDKVFEGEDTGPKDKQQDFL